MQLLHSVLNTLATEILIGNSAGLRTPGALQYNRDIQYAESRL